MKEGLICALSILIVCVGIAVVVLGSIIFYNWYDDNHYDWEEKRKQKRTNRGWLQSLGDYDFAKWLVDSSKSIYEKEDRGYEISGVLRWLREKHTKDNK